MSNDITNKRIFTFLLTEVILVCLVSLPLFILHPEDSSPIVMGMLVVFMFLPLISTLITRKITHDKNKLPINFKLKGNIRYYLLSMYLPTVLIIAGAAIYFVAFPGSFDLSMGYLNDMLVSVGQEPVQLDLSYGMLPIIAIAAILGAPLVIVNHIAAFGEEIGWRGYLQPLMVKQFGVVRGLLLNGACWGLVHAPAVCFGLNYTGDYFGRPFTGIAMMVVFATTLGIFFSYLTMKTRSVIPACIAHGVVNAIREMPLMFCAVGAVNVLLGPKPSGIIGMAGFIVLAVVLLVKMNKEAKAGKTADNQEEIS